jgi:hypothetical protein
MTLSILLTIAGVAALVLLASVGVLAFSTYRLLTPASAQSQAIVTRQARTAVIAMSGILIGIFILLWAYRQFIALKGHVPS